MKGYQVNFFLTLNIRNQHTLWPRNPTFRYLWDSFAAQYQSASQCRRHGFGTWVRKIPWRRKWQPTLVFLLGKSHGQRSYSHGIAKSQKQQLAHNVIEIAIVVQLLSCDRLFCNPINCRPPSSSVHGIFPVRMLEWIAIFFSRGSPWPRYQTCVFGNVGRFFAPEAPRKPKRNKILIYKDTCTKYFSVVLFIETSLMLIIHRTIIIIHVISIFS